MQKIILTGSAESKMKALEPYVGEVVTIHVKYMTFSNGTLAALDRFKATISCEESGDEFYVRYSDMESATVRSQGNWNSAIGNAASAKTERLQVRCTLEQRVVIERAAGNGRGDLSEFILQAALDKAKSKNSRRKQ